MSAGVDRAALSRKDRAEKIALFRYRLIRDAADDSVTPRQRGPMVRALAGEHPGPFGEPVHVSKDTLDRWIRAWRRGGFDALKPAGRTQGPLTAPGVLALAETLKRENPARTAAQVRRIMIATLGDAPSESTLLRHFRSLDIPTGTRRRPPGGSRLLIPTRSGSATGCTDRGSPAARPTCSRSSMTTPGWWSPPAGPTPRTPSGWPLHYARRWSRGGSPKRSTSTTDRPSAMPR